MDKKTDIRQLSLDDLRLKLTELGEKPFRASQIYQWLWQKRATTFDEMTNLSLSLRKTVEDNFIINAIQLKEAQKSSDKTIKNAFLLSDQAVVEGVLIPTKKRMTACVSVQVGCSLDCAFCATGKLKRVRNLNPDEIFDQVAMISDQSKTEYDIPLSNIVFMGMGEPLLNYKNVLASIEKITSADGLGMSPKRITLSTAGIARRITKLADDEVKFNLALYLHAANDQKRNKIMPINESNSLNVLKEAMIYFQKKTNSRPTIEYIIFKDFNDELIDAQELADFCKSFSCKVNIIEYNPIDGGKYQQAEPQKSR